MGNKFIREHIREIKPYEPVVPLNVLSEQLGIPIERLIKIDANENPYGMPPSARKRLAAVEFGHIYPDPESRRLRSALSDYLGIPKSNILAGAGADELIDLIVRLSFNSGDAIINCPPTFGFYSAVSQIHDLAIINIDRKDNFSVDLECVQQAAANGAKGIFLANPNNPDGGLLSRQDLDFLLDLPILVVIDEAYIEFAPPSSTVAHEVLSRNNLVVLRTFSKWGGLAGIRLGYGIFPADYLDELMKIKQPYNVSVAAQEAGLGALQDVERLNQQSENIRKERQRLWSALNEIHWLAPYPTQANFVLCKVLGKDAHQVKRALAARGILIRYFDQPRLQDHLRFSVGTAQDTKRLIEALKEIKS
jgi:histidinol-phosphate aminotransferase